VVSLSSRDEPSIANEFDEFVKVDKQFLATREYALLQDILEAIKQQDADILVQKVNFYGS
jgi:hypothetical protein